jgi:NADPH-dependent curcumin reductase CurA
MGGHEASLEVMGYISQGLIHPLITEKGLEDIPQSMQDLADCRTVGKTVVRLG